MPVLRVCADPNNLPFSNRAGEGFENRIAELLAADRGARLEYKWIYGAGADQIYSTISQGRPDGMPSFGGHITTQQIWQLVAYVQSMAGQVKATSAPSRNDDPMTALLESRRSPQTPVQTGHR